MWDWFNLILKNKHLCFFVLLVYFKVSDHKIAVNTTDLETLLFTTHHTGSRGIYKGRMTGVSCIWIMFELLVAYHTHGQHIHFAIFISVLSVKHGKYRRYHSQSLPFPAPLLSDHESMPLECSNSKKFSDSVLEPNILFTSPIIRTSGHVQGWTHL